MQKNRQIWTVKQILDWSVSYFIKKDIPQPKLSAELLLSSILKYTRMQLYLNFDHIVKEAELAMFKNYLLKRLRHTPIQYILKESYFRNIKLNVDENVLIPRPETELLVDRVLLSVTENILNDKFHCLQNNNKNINILEIGTGSGAIAISIACEIDSFIAKQIPKGAMGGGSNTVDGLNNFGDSIKWKIIATEYSTKALDVAADNAQNILDLKKLENIEFLNADIIPHNEDYFISKYKNNINIIVSNPPYISEKDYENLPDEVRLFEPKEALLAGVSGLEIYKRILDLIFPFLNNSSGTILFETDPKIAQDLEKLVMHYALKNKFNECKINIENDYNNRQRILIARLSS